MSDLKHINPLWIISFNPSNKPNIACDLRKQATISFNPGLKEKSAPIPNEALPLLKLDPKEQLLALDFLDHLNNCFKDLTEDYFKKMDKTPEIEGQLNEIRDRFDYLHDWIARIKKLFKPE